jgi:CubicO group peptidase (beta-lactamase class C family)
MARRTVTLLFCGMFCAAFAAPLVCAEAPVPAPTANSHAFNPAALEQLRAAIEESIARKELPGAVLCLGRDDGQKTLAFGARTLEPNLEAATEDTVYDLASLTKVFATAPSILLLYERGKLDIDKSVATYIPEFAAHGKETITLKHLLTHTSGLRSGLGRASPWHGADAALKLACDETPQRPPGKVFVYSDINFIVLGAIVERVSGETLDVFAQRELYAPLKMTDTGFLPRAALKARIAPTEKLADAFGVAGETKGDMLRGTVHDPTARRMGGVAGHAGLFSTAADMSRFCRMLLNGGELDGVRLFKPDTVRLMTTPQIAAALPDDADAVPTVRRGLGWDIVSPYDGPRGAHFPKTSFGHTGWTGTSVWIDPASRSYVILLSNRNHPDGKGDVRALRRTVGTLAAEALGASGTP